MVFYLKGREEGKEERQEEGRETARERMLSFAGIPQVLASVALEQAEARSLELSSGSPRGGGDRRTRASLCVH